MSPTLAPLVAISTSVTARRLAALSESTLVEYLPPRLGFVGAIIHNQGPVILAIEAVTLVPAVAKARLVGVLNLVTRFWIFLPLRSDRWIPPSVFAQYSLRPVVSTTMPSGDPGLWRVSEYLNL